MFWPVRNYNRGNTVTKSYDEVDAIMGNVFNDFAAVFGETLHKDADGNYVKEIECPGFNKENLSVEVSDGVLQVSGERKGIDGEERTLYKRYRMGTFEEVDAKVEDGILYLTFKIPKEKKQKIELK